MQDLLVAAATDPGLQREINEDRIICDPERGIFAVIDGVGGHASGEVAANIARERLLRVLSKTVAVADSRLREAITLANNAIYDQAKSQPPLRGMSCVLTVALVENGRFTVGHVGDTRLYKLRDGRIRQVTRDHSPIGEREADGSLTEMEAMQHPRRNEIYRDLGTERHDTEDEGFIDVFTEAFEPDCALLLCSDGLTDLVPSRRIYEMVERNAGNPEMAVEELIAAAKEEGGKDNISVIVVEGEGFAETRRLDATPRRSASRPGGFSAQAKSERSIWQRIFSRKEAKGRPRKRPAATKEKPGGRGRRGTGCFTFVVLVLLAGLLVLGLQVRKLMNPPPELPLLTVEPGGPFRSIRQALEQARPGQTVQVAAGVYHERIELRDGVALVSRRPRGAVLRLINEGSADELVAVSAQQVRGARFVGFHLVGDGDNPLRCGLYLAGSEVEVEDLEISGATVAVEISEGDHSRLRSSYLHHNEAAVRIHGDARPRLVQNLIQDNTTGVEILDTAFPLALGNHFVANGVAWVAPDDARKAELLGWSHLGTVPAERRFRVATPPSPQEDSSVPEEEP